MTDDARQPQFKFLASAITAAGGLKVYEGFPLETIWQAKSVCAGKNKYKPTNLLIEPFQRVNSQEMP